MKPSGSSALITLMQLHPLVPPRFPTLSELTTSPPTSAAPSRGQSLYSALIGNPNVLLEDLVRRPEHYERGVAELLQELSSGQRTLDGLSTSELALLDRATVDWNQSYSATPSTQEKTAMDRASGASSRSSSTDELDDDDEEMPDDLIPEGEINPTWYL